MSELLPSELARLILGYFEGKGYSRTAETMLSELPELSEINQRRKKGRKINLRVGDQCLTDILDDYSFSKELVLENIEKYPATFASLKKIQSLADHVKSLLDLAIKNKTYKVFPKNPYKNNVIHASKLMSSKGLDVPDNISITIGDSIDGSQTSYKNLDIDATQESSLPGSPKKNTTHTSQSQPVTEEKNDKELNNSTPESTPQKRKGSLRKRPQPSPKNLPKTNPSVEEEKIEKLLKNLIDNTALHQKIADNINRTLFEKEHCLEDVNQEQGQLDSSQISPSKIDSQNAEVNKSFGSLSDPNLCIGMNYGEASSGRTNNLEDIVSSLTLQVANDPVVESILATLSSSSPTPTSSSRLLNTPVPPTSPVPHSLSIHSPMFNSFQSCNSMQDILNQPMNNPSGEFTLEQCFKTQDSNQGLKAIIDSHSIESQKSCASLQICNDDKQNFSSSALQAPYLNNVKKDLLFSLKTPSTRFEVGDSPNKAPPPPKNKDTQLHLDRHPMASIGSFPHQNQVRSEYTLQPESKSINHQGIQSETGNCEGVSGVSEDKFRTKFLNNQSLPSLGPSLHSESSINHVENMNKRTKGQTSKKKIRCTFISDDQVQIIDTSMVDRLYPSCDYIEKEEHENRFLYRRMSSHSCVPPLDPNLNQPVLPPPPPGPPTYSPMRPPPAEAVPVNASSNDPFINSKYFSGTPDHHTNYTLTELAPLTTLPQGWNSPSNNSVPTTPTVLREGAPISVTDSNELGQRQTEGALMQSISSDPLVKQSNVLKSQRTVITNEATSCQVLEVPDFVADNGSSIIVVQMPYQDPNLPTIYPKPSNPSEQNEALNFKNKDSEAFGEEESVDEDLGQEASPKSKLKNSNKRCKEIKSTFVKRQSKKDTKISSLRRSKTSKEKYSVPLTSKYSERKKISKDGMKNSLVKRSIKEGIHQSSEVPLPLLKQGSDETCSELASVYDDLEKGASSKSHIKSNSISHEHSHVSSEAVTENVQSLAEVNNSVKVDCVTKCSKKKLSSSEDGKIMINSDVDLNDLVEELETRNVEDISLLKNQSLSSITEKEDSSDQSMTAELKSLISFSQSFIINSNIKKSGKSPLSNERIKVHKGSLSTPRNKSHIRALDFGTPRKVLSGKKRSPRAKTNLHFNSPSPPKPVFSKRTNFKSPVRSVSLKSSLSMIPEEENSLNLPKIKENPSAKELDSSLRDPRIIKESSNSCLLFCEGVEKDLFLSEDEGFAPDESHAEETANTTCRILIAETPAKNFLPVCLEPSTPFLANQPPSSVHQSFGSELNTPVPPTMPITPVTKSPYLKAYPQGPYSDSSEGTYYQPSERSVTDSEVYSPLQEDIESALIRAAQKSEQELSKFCPPQPVVTEKVTEAVIEKNDQNKTNITETNPLFEEILKTRPSYKIRKMNNEQLGKAIEEEMELFKKMKDLVRKNQPEVVETQEVSESKTPSKCDNARNLRSRTAKRKRTYSTKTSNKNAVKNDGKIISLEDFDFNIDLLKNEALNILEKSHIKSSKNVLRSLKDLFDKDEGMPSSFSIDERCQFLVDLINFYGRPSILRKMKTKYKNLPFQNDAGSSAKTMKKPLRKVGKTSGSKLSNVSPNSIVKRKNKHSSEHKEKIYTEKNVIDNELNISLMECEIEAIFKDNLNRTRLDVKDSDFHCKSEINSNGGGNEGSVIANRKENTEISHTDSIKLDGLPLDKSNSLTDSVPLSRKQNSCEVPTTPCKTKVVPPSFCQSSPNPTNSPEESPDKIHETSSVVCEKVKGGLNLKETSTVKKKMENVPEDRSPDRGHCCTSSEKSKQRINSKSVVNASPNKTKILAPHQPSDADISLRDVRIKTDVRNRTASVSKGSVEVKDLFDHESNVMKNVANISSSSNTSNALLEKSFETESDYYSKIERQLAALDGSVINSPAVREELNSNVIDDENISAMFTPTSQSQFLKSSNSLTPKECTTPTKLNSNSMIAFTPLPGTPYKKVEEICQSVVKNKIALVAFPSQCREVSEENLRRQSKKHSNKIKKVLDELQKQDKCYVETSSLCQDTVLSVTTEPLSRKEVESLPVYNSEEVVRENSNELMEEVVVSCSLTFSDTFDLFSLNLDDDSFMDGHCIDVRNSSLQKRESKKKNVSSVSNGKNSKKVVHSDNRNNSKNSSKTNSAKKSMAESSNKTSKKRLIVDVDESLEHEPLGCPKEKKNKLVDTPKEPDESSKVVSPSHNLTKPQISKSNKKLAFPCFRKRERCNDEIDKEIVPKSLQTTPNTSCRSYVPNSISSQNTHTSGEKNKLKGKPSSLKNDAWVEMKSVGEMRETNRPVVEEDVPDNPSHSVVYMDDTESLESLHISSSESDDSVAEVLPSGATGVARSLYKGASLEVSKTPEKLQTKISNYPSMENIFYSLEGSECMVPPTPGKDIILPSISTSTSMPVSDSQNQKLSKFQQKDTLFSRCFLDSEVVSANDLSPEEKDKPRIGGKQPSPRRSSRTSTRGRSPKKVDQKAGTSSGRKGASHVKNVVIKNPSEPDLKNIKNSKSSRKQNVIEGPPSKSEKTSERNRRKNRQNENRDLETQALSKLKAKNVQDILRLLHPSPKK